MVCLKVTPVYAGVFLFSGRVQRSRLKIYNVAAAHVGRGEKKITIMITITRSKSIAGNVYTTSPNPLIS